MAFDDLLAGVEGLVAKAGDSARNYLSFAGDHAFGTGMPASRLTPPDELQTMADLSMLPSDTGEAFGRFDRWHSALGHAVRPAVAGAAMAAVGFPAAALLGAGYDDSGMGTSLRMTDDVPLARPEGTFATTTDVGRFLKLATPGLNDLGLPDSKSTWKGLAKQVSPEANDLGAGFLEVTARHLAQELPTLRQYTRESGDPMAPAKAMAMLLAQLDFAENWDRFSFEGESAGPALAEWRKMVTTGRGTEAIAIDAITKVAKAVEWVQHPELYVAPAAGLAYINMDEDEPAVGLRVLQWQAKAYDELTPQEIAGRVNAASALHPSGLVEMLVDNVRDLLHEAMGSPLGDPAEFIAEWRAQGGAPLDEKDNGHVTGLPGAPSLLQARKALETVAAEAGRVQDQPVTPAEINAIIRDVAGDRPFPGPLFDLITGKGIPALGQIATLDLDTDLTRYRSRPRDLRMSPEVGDPGQSLEVMIEGAADGSFKVMSEDGSSAFRNRAVGFLPHNGRHATVPVRPRGVVDAKASFAGAVGAGTPGDLWELDVTEKHPAFAEGPKLMVSYPSAASAEAARTIARVTRALQAAGMTATTESLPPHMGTERDDEAGLRQTPMRSEVLSLATVSDLHRIAADAQDPESAIGKLMSEVAMQVRFYVNTAMDAPPGTVRQWETFATDERGRLTATLTADGAAHRTDQVPHWRLPDHAIGSEAAPPNRGVLSARDGSGEPWSEGPTVWVRVPAHGSGEVAEFSHSREDFEGEEVVEVHRRPNGNVSIRLPADEDGTVESVTAKAAHEIMSLFGRSNLSLGVQSDE